MFQVLAVLALMAMTAPFLMRQAAREKARVEDRTVAEQTTRIERAVKEYLTATAAKRTVAFSRARLAQAEFEILDYSLRPYLPETYFENNKIRPNRLVDSYTMTGFAKCVEAVDSQAKQCNPAALTPVCSCVRYLFNALVQPNRSK